MRRCLDCEYQFTGVDWRCPSCGVEPEYRDGIPTFAPSLAWGHAADATYEFDALSAAETRHFWFDARNRIIVWALGRYFPEARSLFDIGCGTGGVLSAIRRARPELGLSAGDALMSGLRHARGSVPDASILQLDVGRLPYAEEFDVTAAFDVLEHVDDDEAVLGEMRRVTVRGGGVLLTVPQHPRLWSEVDDFSHHRRRYTRRDLLDKVKRAGLLVERATSFMTLILPAIVASRFIGRRQQPFDPVDELKPSAVANSALAAACAFERRLVTLGLDLPIGGSLLVVARRG